MHDEKDIEPVIVFAGTQWEAELIKSLLENEEIHAYILDEFIGTLAPWYTAPGGAGSVRVSVSSLDVLRAKRVVEEYEKNRKSEG
ncbi:MAG TPA: DUF2007-related protein [Bacteroidales bacterium]|nr:DUF2007-related protein [Bacteroidales bacterium]